MITGHGTGSAKVMLIGDSGSEEDVGSGKALSGKVEDTLKRFIKENQLDWNDFYSTLLIKERGSQKDWKLNIDLVSNEYREVLKGEISTINPNVIIPINELAFNFVTGLKSIRKYRGSILPTKPDLVTRETRVLPILGPNPFLNEAPWLYFISRLDFTKVKANLDKHGPIEDIGFTWIANDSTTLRNFFTRHYSRSSFVVFDIETHYGIPTCISFCFDGNESCTVPILDKAIAFDTRALMAIEVARLLAAPIPKVNQNIKFDWKKLERFGFYVNNVVGDTLIAASTLYPEFPKNLGFLTSIYTDMPYHKDEGKDYNPATDNRSRLYLYCAKDSLATHKIYSQQLEEIKLQGVGFVYNQLMKVFPIYKKMETVGMRVDDERRKNLIAKYESLFEITRFKLCRLSNQDDLNPLSPKQIRKLVYEDLGYKTIRGIKTNKNGEPSTDEDSLEMLIWKGYSQNPDAGEILKCQIACRKLHKVLEFLQDPIHPDGRLHYEYNLGGTETGRTSASSTTDNYLQFDGKKIKSIDLGHSPQTIGKHGFEIDGEVLGRELRSMFVPDSGYAFVECDLSQAEARVDAVLAKDFNMLEVFDGPIGIHKLTGSWIYDCDPLEIKKGILVGGVDRYHEAKTARHAGERNMKAERLMVMINRPLNECEKILKKFHDKQPNIRDIFHKEIYKQLQDNRVLIAPNGRRRDFFGRFDSHMVNEGISQLPQAIVSDQLKFSLSDTMDECPWAIPLVEAHDGFLAEVPIGREEEYARVFKKNVETEIDFETCSLSRKFKLRIPMEAESSTESWQSLKHLGI